MSLRSVLAASATAALSPQTGAAMTTAVKVVVLSRSVRMVISLGIAFFLAGQVY